MLRELKLKAIEGRIFQRIGELLKIVHLLKLLMKFDLILQTIV